MSYLERWWRDSSERQRESFTNLVKNGQLEIVGGGWVMNDEVISLRLSKLSYCSILNIHAVAVHQIASSFPFLSSFVLTSPVLELICALIALQYEVIM